MNYEKYMGKCLKEEEARVKELHVANKDVEDCRRDKQRTTNKVKTYEQRLA